MIQKTEKKEKKKYTIDLNILLDESSSTEM